MTNVLLLTNKLQDSPSGGRELLCKLNHDVLKDIYGDNLIVFELVQSKLQGAKSFVNAFRGHINGLNSAVIVDALQKIRANNVSKIFVDGSNFGEFVQVIKKEVPHVLIYTFFHNTEARFFLGLFKQAKTLHALGVLIAIYLAEKKSVKFSDEIISLSERDSRMLKKIYGRSATHVSSMALEDKLKTEADITKSTSNEEFALFVGGTFYANRAGISWFVKHVVPRITIKTYIVGKGFENFRHELEVAGKVEVVGAVKSLAEWYKRAHFVIAPIFDGSGMKTKVAEAMMYGKKIIGTPEAFSGYEDISERAGWVCTTADDFVSAIDVAKNEITLAFDPVLRALYKEKYSYLAARLRFMEILNVGH